VRACHPENEPAAGIEERIDRVEKAIENGVAAARPAESAAPKAEKPAAAAKPEAPAKKIVSSGPEIEPPAEYLKALELFGADNPSMRATLPSMRFAGLAEGRVDVEFPKKNMMHMKMLERKQAALDQAFSDAFGRPMHAAMRLEGDKGSAPASASAEARRRIEQSYDVFGRENIEITD